MSVNEWSCGLRHHSPSSRVTAGTAMLALPLLWGNQSSGSCTGLYIRWCLFCCQLYRNPLPKACNCRMFCYPIPAASYYLLRLSRVTSPGLIVITDKAWGQEFCLSSARGIRCVYIPCNFWGVSMYRAVRRTVKSFEMLQGMDVWWWEAQLSSAFVALSHWSEFYRLFSALPV